MRGGYRAGAGRPRGSGAAIKVEPLANVKLADGDLSPLEYVLRVINDEEADPERRDRLAIAALPFVHVRRADRKPSAKQEAQARAEEVAGGGWDELLNPDGRPPRKFQPRPVPRGALGNNERPN